MKHKSLYILLLLLTALQGCYLLKKSRDRHITQFALSNREEIKEAAAIAVAIAFEQRKNSFFISQVIDTSVKRKLRSFGNMITVCFNDGPCYEIQDSCVTFTTITLVGATDIIYDFAARDRKFEDKKDNRHDYYFIRVADRLYYRRRTVPMM